MNANDNGGHYSHSNTFDDVLNLDLVQVRQYAEAIEVAVMINQFSECALLLNELVGVVRENFMTDEGHANSCKKNCSQRAVDRARSLMIRCRDPLQTSDDLSRVKLSDDIRNGLVLIVSDLVDREHYVDDMRA